MVKSKVNAGSTFSFTLSFQKANTNLAANQEQSAQVKSYTEIKAIKLLLVEDVKLN